VSSVLVCDLPKSAKHMLIVEFADLEIRRADERYSASMAEYLPKPPRTFYCGGGARAFNRFTSSNAAIIEIERQCHEKSDVCHRSRLWFCRDDRNGHGSRKWEGGKTASVVSLCYAPLTTAFLARRRIDFSTRLRWLRDRWKSRTIACRTFNLGLLRG
jgi:hypothetical protein